MISSGLLGDLERADANLLTRNEAFVEVESEAEDVEIVEGAERGVGVEVPDEEGLVGG